MTPSFFTPSMYYVLRQELRIIGMKESRQQQLLQGQSSQARKIFEAVPIAESWTESTINKAIRLTGAQIIPSHTLRACLRDMCDAGLVRETPGGYYQRIAVTRTAPTSQKAPEQMSSQSAPVRAAAPEILVTHKVDLGANTPEEPKPSAGTVLIALAIQVNELHASFSKGIATIAEQLEAVATQVEQEQEANAESLKNLAQLRTLLKGI